MFILQRSTRHYNTQTEYHNDDSAWEDVLVAKTKQQVRMYFQRPANEQKSGPFRRLAVTKHGVTAITYNVG